MPPVLLQHGRKDHVMPYQCSRIFYDQAVETAGTDKAVFEILEAADHADKLFETKENMERVINFIDGYLRQEKK